MQKAIIKNGQIEYKELTPEEEIKVNERVIAGDEQLSLENKRKQDKLEALDRLKKSGQSWITDLLLVLDLDE